MLVPGSVIFSPDMVWRINRVRIAERLHVLPTAVDSMPYYDVLDCLTLWAEEGKGPGPQNK